MKTAIILTLLLGLAAALAAQIGCGTAPAAQADKTASVARAEKEVGYKKGMHIPEFGMSLLDGTRVTSAKLVEEGKPTFIYFHATW